MDCKPTREENLNLPATVGQGQGQDVNKPKMLTVKKNINGLHHKARIDDST